MGGEADVKQKGFRWTNLHNDKRKDTPGEEGKEGQF